MRRRNARRIGELFARQAGRMGKIDNPIVSIDDLELKEFDYIDIGTILDTSGAVPVVIKSLVFPTGGGLGKNWQAVSAIAAGSE